MISRIYLSLIVVGLLFFSCKKKNESDAIDLHTEYAGLMQSKFIIYDATEIFHDDPSGIHDTSNYLLKTRIGDLYVDLEGRPGYEIERYKSFDNGLNWELTDIWYGVAKSNRLEIVEENERKVRLIFPPRLNSKWDLNIYNSKAKSDLEYIEIHASKTCNNEFFDSVVVVQQEKLFTLVDFKKQTETYAKGVGLIDKYFKNLTISNFDTLDVQRGTEYFLKLKAHGFE
ncbi:MAG: hypothetical protein KJ941_01125 [Bacteroidetes bacterium]|nr:hypothetical protein [Bacteroidota bacterium]